ncbi:MAG: aquaporin [Oligoflexia bacterium]|nr:aquaporin [Oligoflexia bacterium]
MDILKARHFFGEMIGTFIIVLFGCGSVAVSILFNTGLGLAEVALIWGITVSLAIYATRYLSCAHLNPAVSIGLAIAGRMSYKKVPMYVLAQFLGGIVAALLLYLLFNNSITSFENLHNIVRGSNESIKTAMMFGEFYPNPSAGQAATVSMGLAFAAEFIGTAILLFFIMILTHDCNIAGPGENLIPLFIGLAVTVDIVLIASITQAGFNPARDFAPRLIAYFAGWGNAALAGGSFFSSIIVYVLAPITGASCVALLFRFVLDKLMFYKEKNNIC